MPLVSYISTCMGRLEHLRRALPTWLAQPDSEVVVVDWSCPDGSGDWVKAHHAQAGVVRVPGRAHFNLAAARNAGAARASGRWLCFVDADVLLDPGFSVLVHPLLDPAAYLLSEGGPHELMGTVVVPADAFRAVGGYDEAIEGWGAEDHDLYTRLRWRGLERRRYPHHVLSSIPHDESQRVAHAALKDRGLNWMVNRAYLEAKWSYLKLREEELDLEARRDLYRHVRATILEALESGRHPELAFSLGWRRLVSGVEYESSFTVRLRPAGGGAFHG